MEQSQRSVQAFQPKTDLYPINKVSTSRYDIITFLPKCLFEQFRRLANVYFVVIGVIACIGYYGNYYESALEPAAILAPVTLVVMISVLKEGIEDVKRHQADAVVNARPVRCVGKDGSVSNVQWQELQVGSIVILNSDEEIPADIIVLASGGVQGNTAYVETAAIDGETNLKIRLPALAKDVHKSAGGINENSLNPMVASSKNTAEAPNAVEVEPYEESIKVNVTDAGTTVTGVEELNIVLNAEAPNSSIHHFDGSVEFKDASPEHIQHHATLSEKNLLLRGAVIRATEWTVGIVVYTGQQTKLSLNSRAPPSKLSAVDRVVNRALAVAIGVMVFVCFVSMSFSIAWQSKNSNADYLCLTKDDLSPQYVQTGGSGGCSSAAPSSFLTVFTFATLFNNFVCISMYVSLEMIYLCQAYFIENDLNLYDETTDTPAECHTSGMCADIGQVQYVLSDKTGTLTKNIMTLRRCSIAGLVYGAPLKPPKVTSDLEDVVADPDEDDEITSPMQEGEAGKRMSTSSVLSSSGDKSYHELEEMGSHRMLHPISQQNAELMSEFLWNLSVCNTVMLMPDSKTGKLNITDNESLKKCLNAESPDEVALVLAASEYGNEMITRRDTSEVIVKSLNRNGVDKDYSFTVLATNEFESDRKRMSILIRKPGQTPMLYCKGADTSMLPHCKPSAAYEACLKHIDEFAVTGLRTLVMSRKVLTEDEADKWLAKYKTASNNIGRRKEMLSECALEIETDMELLGAVGIEDELQDGVSNAIQMLQRAGLNVWMITGDKPETAIAISEMCSLLRPEHHVMRIVGLSGDDLKEKVKEIGDVADNQAAAERLRIKMEEDERVQSPVVKWLKSTACGRYCYMQYEEYWMPCCQSLPCCNDEYDEEESTSPTGSEVSVINPIRMSMNRESSHRRMSALKHIATVGGIEVGQLALVVDGTSLEAIWANDEIKMNFMEAVRGYPTVVACRVSPLQKATLVKMVKASPGRPMTLAIGDGANDVGMIHESRVGVGISGREGRHAANSADFAIGQFQFLVPLLLHHGRFNYIRCSKLVLYSFFKNLTLVSILFYYCFFSGFSGTIFVDSFILSGYNFYLGLPIIALGALDFDISKEEAMKFPKLAYNSGRLGELLNNWNMLRWCSIAFVYGLLLYTLLIRFFSGYMSATSNGNEYIEMEGIGFNNDAGQDGGIYAEGFLIFTVLVCCMQYKVAMMTCSPSYIYWILWVLSFVGYFLFSWVYGMFPTVEDWYHITNFSTGLGKFWLAMAVVPIFFITTDYMLEETLSVLFPKSKDILKIKLAEYAGKRQSASNVNITATTGVVNTGKKLTEEAGRKVPVRQTSISSL